MNVFDPYILKTSDYGKTWKLITGGIPHSMLSFTHVVREDPVRKGLLYSGTGQVIDPLIHYVGPTNVNFIDGSGSVRLFDLKRFIDHQRKTVTSSNRQLKLDYGKGVLTINAPAAQGISGNLRQAGDVKLTDLQIFSDMDLGHIVAVSLDDTPLAKSNRILLQVMSEEQASEFRIPIGG